MPDQPNNLRAPKNTAKMSDADNMLMLGDAMTSSAGDAIENQEANGQRDFVGSDTLPTKMSADDKAALERLGFEFLGNVPDDPIFQYVKMPEGWAKKATDHSMHSDLLDSKGRKRGSIFYKAAFYDRSAHFHLHRRFNLGREYDNKESLVAFLSDGGERKEVLVEEKIKHPGGGRDHYRQQEQVWEAAREKMAELYPDHEDPTAYWE